MQEPFLKEESLEEEFLDAHPWRMILQLAAPLGRSWDALKEEGMENFLEAGPGVLSPLLVAHFEGSLQLMGAAPSRPLFISFKLGQIGWVLFIL